MSKRIFSNKETNKIIKRYLNLEGTSAISKDYDTDSKAIRRLLEINNIKIRTIQEAAEIRRIKCNDDYFSVIDSEDKAYFLGLLMADGNVGERWTPRISIHLQERDGYILEKFAKYIQYEGNLRFEKKRQESHQNKIQISLTSNKLARDLALLNCVPRKSLTLKFPPLEKIPDSLIHHFLRGYFDGDGCITETKRPTDNIPHFRIDFASSFDFCKSAQEVIFKKTGIMGNIRPQGKIFRLHFTGNQKIRIVSKFLYENSTLFLTRKRDKFLYLDKCKVITTSKYKHVHYRTNELKRNNLTKKWMSTLKVKGKTRFVGVYLTEFEAYIGLCQFEIKNKMPFSNNPDEFYNLSSINLSSKF